MVDDNVGKVRIGRITKGDTVMGGLHDVDWPVDEVQCADDDNVDDEMWPF